MCLEEIFVLYIQAVSHQIYGKFDFVVWRTLEADPNLAPPRHARPPPEFTAKRQKSVENAAIYASYWLPVPSTDVADRVRRLPSVWNSFPLLFLLS